MEPKGLFYKNVKSIKNLSTSEHTNLTNRIKGNATFGREPLAVLLWNTTM